MNAESICGKDGDICLTLVELALAQSNLSGCDPGLSDVEIPGSGFGDTSHANPGCDDGRLYGLDISDVCSQTDLVYTMPVTYPLPYVTQPDPTPRTDIDHYLQQTNAPLQFDLDCLSVDQAFTAAASKNPVTAALSDSNSDDCLLLDSAASMPSSEVAAAGAACAGAADKIPEIGRRKKAVPRRHSQPLANKSDTLLPATVTSLDHRPEKPADDFARLAKYVPACLEKFGFCVVDRFAGKQLASSVRSEVLAMYERGSFEDGLLTNQAFAVTAVRGDRVCWLEHEDHKHCASICKLIRCLDDLFLRLRGCLGSCHISSRSKVSGTDIPQ